MNVGLSDSGLLTHLSEATAGSLNGIGHSTAYEELATYSWVSISLRGSEMKRSDDELGHRLAVNYLFMTNEGMNKHPELVLQPFDAKVERNDYEVSNRCCYVAYRAPSLTPFFSISFSYQKRSPGRYAI